MTTLEPSVAMGRPKSATLAGGLSSAVLLRATKDAFVKLDPRRPPVAFMSTEVIFKSPLRSVRWVNVLGRRR